MTTFRSLWVGPRLSPLEQLCIRSFLARGHAFELYAYDAPAGVPAGCTLLPAGSILPREAVFTYRKGPRGRGSPAAFANLFRYKLLLERGGWWVDCDMVCLDGPAGDPEVFFASEDDRKQCNAVLRFPAGHPLARRLFEEASAAGRDLDWGETGPALLTRVLAEEGWSDRAAPPSTVFPLHWREWSFLVDPHRAAIARERLRGAMMVHLWNQMYRDWSLDTAIAPPAGSVLAQWYVDHGLWSLFDRQYVLERDGDRLRMRVVPRGEAGAGPAAAR